MDYKESICVVAIGGPNSGKTSFLRQKLTEEYTPTIGVDFQLKNRQFMGESYKLQIWDTAGDPKFKAMSPTYLKNCKFIIFMFDASRRNSYFQCEKLLNQILTKKYIPAETMGCLIATKCDLNRQVTTQQGEELGKRIGSYYEISLKESPNVQEQIFNEFLKDYVNGNIKTIYTRNEGISLEQTAPPECKEEEIESEKVEQAPKTEAEKKTAKCLIIGHQRGGKTSLIQRFCEDKFSQNYTPTIGVDLKMKTIACNGVEVKLQFWDTAGQQRYRAIINSLYKNTKIFVLVYDCQDGGSFEKIDQFHKQIFNFGEPNESVLYLVANKSQEVEQIISAEEGEAKAKSLGMEFIEVSALNSLNVETLFFSALDKLLKQEKI